MKDSKVHASRKVCIFSQIFNTNFKTLYNFIKAHINGSYTNSPTIYSINCSQYLMVDQEGNHALHQEERPLALCIQAVALFLQSVVDILKSMTV
ncbi:hypothetical protein QYF36_002349 [Acer negundo]|nr:hypothetical protein QYF36_002349 [Acer negundo]